MKYFEDVVTNGEWDEVEKYLSVFTNYNDNGHSLGMFYEIKKQKYLEALDKPDYGKAVEILRNELAVFSFTHDDDLTKMTLLLRLPNFRENAELSKYGDTKQARSNLLGKLKMSIKENPLLRDKLRFPNIANSRLLNLIGQSLNWQHSHCKNPNPSPVFETLYADHFCGQIYGAQAPSRVNTQLTLGGPTSSSARDNTGSESVQKRARHSGSVNELNNHPICILPPGQTHPHTSYSSAELPIALITKVSYRSSVTSMDFHPVQQTLLLVGTNTGDIVLWEVGNRNMHTFEKFKVNDIRKCSASLQASLAKDPTVSVNCVKWNSDGMLLGVAYSKSFVRVYSYRDYCFLLHREIEAHVGYVSDLAFSHPNEQLCIITCGEDKAIKVWDAVTGAMQYKLEGHEAPVYSVCPHHHNQIQFIVSNSVDGKIKAWLYDNKGPRVTADAPGQSCTRMASSADGTRVFSCGTSKDGKTHVVEWDILKGAVKRSYIGLGKQATGVVQFDTLNNRFLVAGDEFHIKFWDVENVNLVAAAAHGGSLASPCISLSKEGIFLAVSAGDNSVIILGNKRGYRHVNPIPTLDQYRAICRNVGKSSGDSGLSVATKRGLVERDAPLNVQSHTWPHVNRRMTGEMAKSRVWEPEEISKQSQLRFLRLPDTLSSAQITRLIYSNSGGAILSLACNGVHKLWKWQKNEQNQDGKATVNFPPELWQPANRRPMINDISKTKPEDAVACLALTDNDAFVISGSGGKVSVFSIETFKSGVTFMPPPPAATSIALHPQDNNILALGMEDSSILIYDICIYEYIYIYSSRIAEVKHKLEGHRDRVTGLAFSTVLNALVSSGADSQICVWSMQGWNIQASKAIHISSSQAPNPPRKNHVQFHQDQIRLLVFNENLIAIYEAPELKCIKQRVPGDSTGSITWATYSCNSQSVYAAFESGSIIVFSAALVPQCQISPKAYLTASPSTRVYPLAIAAHPSDPNQFAIGLNDGGILVLEPLESGTRWGTITIL